ncbi:MAG TPA: Gfo/Idh/MocA family oxidoreductase [Microlunatus sp.]
MTATTTRWAVLGPGVISDFFARALPRSTSGALHAVGSRDLSRARAFAEEHGAAVSGSYAEILRRDDVDAVYVGTVHTTHADLAITALEAGKAVLCEKPVTPTPADTQAVLVAAERAGLPFLEAYKYRFGPLTAVVRALIGEGAIGRPLHVDASYGGAAAARSGRLFAPELAGGAILDVGGYPVSLAVGIATWAGLASAGTRPSLRSVTGLVGGTGVDEWTSAAIDLGGLLATVHTSLVADQVPRVLVRGSAGSLDLPNIWGNRTESGTEAIVRTTGSPRRITVPVVDPMAAEADAVSLALAEGRSEVPEMTWAESTLVAETLHLWRAGLD